MNTKHTLVTVLVALLVATGGSAALAGDAAETPSVVVQEEDEETEEEDDETDGDDETIEQEGNETDEQEDNETERANVTFANQTSDGSEVVIERATINVTRPAGGFVTVHFVEGDRYVENVTENEIGERIGNSTFLEPGEHENVTVELNQTLEENRTLVAVVHGDNTGNEQFDPEADQPLDVDDEVVADAALVNVSETGETPVTETPEDETPEGDETPENETAEDDE